MIGALALLIPAIAGCEAGTNAPTLEFHEAGGGAYAQVNGIQVSDAFILGGPDGSSVPVGSSASLFLSLSNNGASDDQLTSVTATDYTSTVHVTGSTVSIPVSSSINLMGPQPSIVLSNLTKPVTAGSTIDVTLNFARAGQVTLQVPVEPYEFYYSTYSQPPTPAPTTASPTTTPKAAHKAAKPSSSPTP